MQLRNGLHEEAEAAANELLAAYLETATREDKLYLLTPWKTRHRHLREILSGTGTPIDPSTRRGQFSKAWNRDKPQLNSRDCPTQPIKMSSSWDPDEAAPTGNLSPQMAAIMGVERDDS